MFSDDCHYFSTCDNNNNCKNTHTHSLTYNYNTLFMYYSPLIFQSIAYKYSATSIGTGWHHGATKPRNYCMQPCCATYAMSNHDVQRLHGRRCTLRLRGKVAPCLSALRELYFEWNPPCRHLYLIYNLFVSVQLRRLQKVEWRKRNVSSQ